MELYSWKERLRRKQRRRRGSRGVDFCMLELLFIAIIVQLKTVLKYSFIVFDFIIK
jgi:hypothetical protein